jgi:hypothetical protein
VQQNNDAAAKQQKIFAKSVLASQLYRHISFLASMPTA